MDIQPLQLPNQKMTEAEKIKQFGSVEEWAKQTIKTLIGIGSQTHYLNYDDTYRKQINYNLLSGYVNPDDFKHVTHPYGLTKFNFPATFNNFNIITPKIALLEGEESRRPFNFRIVATGTEDTNAVLRKKDEALRQFFQQSWMQELQGLGVNIQDQQQVQQSTPKEISNYYTYTYRTAKEEAAQSSLEYLQYYCQLKDKFQTGWRDLLTTGEEVFWVGIRHGEPIVDVVNPVYFHYDRNPDLKYIEDSQWAYCEYFMPPADVYDRYFDVLSDKQVETIEQMKGGRSGNTIHNTAIGIPIRYSDIDDGLGSPTMSQSSTVFVHVTHVEWKSLSKIGFVSWVDENGQEQMAEVDEYYKKNPFNDETIDWRWINTVWESTRIGDDIYVNVRPKPNQHRNLDNPSKCKLGYVGTLFNARNSQPYSLVEIMKPHQYLYDIVMYRLELELAKAQGKKMIFDVAQIPRTEGFDLDKWLYYFNVLGISFINSFEEGKGKFSGQRPTFNQFQQIDMSLARVIDQYIMLLDKIENMAGEICGVTRQREGQITSSETVGGVERSVRQSSAITESLFLAHGLCKEHVLTALLDTAKLAWIDGKKTSYVTNDLARVLINIDGADFCNAEFGIFVTDSQREDEILQSIKQLAQYALNSNQATLKDLVKVFKSNNVDKAEKILDDAQKAAQEMAQQQQQAEQQHEQQMQQMQLQIQQQQAQQQAQVEDALNQRDNDTKLKIAIIGAESQSGMSGEQEAQLYAQELEIDRRLKLKELTDKKSVADKKLSVEAEIKRDKQQSDSKVANEKLSSDKSLNERSIKQDLDLEKKRLAAELKAEEERISIERSRAAADKTMQESEQRRKEALDAADLKQQDKEHKREQQTKLKATKIQAKAKPKTPPSK